MVIKKNIDRIEYFKGKPKLLMTDISNDDIEIIKEIFEIERENIETIILILKNKIDTNDKTKIQAAMVP